MCDEDLEDSEGPNRRSATDWLELLGGWVLVFGGTALIGLAAAFADRPAVAPVFAIGGIALLLVGVLLPRVEGQFEFSATGFKFVLAELREQTRGLDAVAKAEVIDQLLEEMTQRGVRPSARAAKRVVNTVVAKARRGLALGHAFARWLQESGWTIVAEGTSILSFPTEFDVVAKKGEEWLVVEAKAAIAPGNDVASVATLPARALRLRDSAITEMGAQVRVAVVVAEQPSASVVESLRRGGIDLYVAAEEGFTYSRAC